MVADARLRPPGELAEAPEALAAAPEGLAEAPEGLAEDPGGLIGTSEGLVGVVFSFLIVCFLVGFLFPPFLFFTF